MENPALIVQAVVEHIQSLTDFTDRCPRVEAYHHNFAENTNFLDWLRQQSVPITAVVWEGAEVVPLGSGELVSSGYMHRVSIWLRPTTRMSDLLTILFQPGSGIEDTTLSVTLPGSSSPTSLNCELPSLLTCQVVPLDFGTLTMEVVEVQLQVAEINSAEPPTLLITDPNDAADEIP